MKNFAGFLMKNTSVISTLSRFLGLAALATMFTFGAQEASAQVKSRNCNLSTLSQDRSASGYIRFDYCLVLGRNVDPSGLSTFLKRWDYGAKYFRNDMRLFSSREIVDRLITSAEGKARFGISNTGDHNKIVRTAYNSLLSREPDAGGLKMWVGEMNRLKANGLSEHDRYQYLMYAFMASPEFKSRYSNYR